MEKEPENLIKARVPYGIYLRNQVITASDTNKKFWIDEDGLIYDLSDINKLKEALGILKEIYKLTNGAWDDPVISEKLYDRIEQIMDSKAS